MVGGAGTGGPCLGSAFCHELSEVILNPLEPPFAKEARGRGALERGRTGSGREEGLGKAVNRAILGAGPWPTSDFESQAGGSRLGRDLRYGRHWASACQAEWTCGSPWSLEQQICSVKSQGRRTWLAQTQEPVSGEQGGGLWLIVMGSWTRRTEGPYREVLWL